MAIYSSSVTDGPSVSWQAKTQENCQTFCKIYLNSVRNRATIAATKVLPAVSSQAGSPGARGAVLCSRATCSQEQVTFCWWGELGAHQTPSQILSAVSRSLGVSEVRHSQNKGSPRPSKSRLVETSQGMLFSKPILDSYTKCLQNYSVSMTLKHPFS